MISKANTICAAACCLLCTVHYSLEAQVPSYVPTDGLVGWWGFNGNAHDESGNGNDGAVNGATLTEDRFGNANSAFAFDGEDDRIVIGNATELNPPENMSVSIWFNTDVYLSEQYIVCKNYDPQPRVWSIRTNLAPSYSTGLGIQSEFRHDNSPSEFAVDGEVSYELGDWNHVVLTYDGVHIYQYFNGALISQTPSSGNLFMANEPISIGYMPHGDLSTYGYFLDGSIDEFGFWNRALTEDEVSALYQVGISGCTDPSACNYTPDATEDDGSCIFPPELELGEDLETCEASVTLDAGPGFDSYLWSTGETTQTIEVSENGDYSVEVGNSGTSAEISGFSFFGTYEGSDYYISESPSTWQVAHAACEAAGGYLVSIQSEEENNWVGAAPLTDCWIGLFQESDQAPWVWADGSPLVFDHWRSDQPTGTNQNCVAFQVDAGISGFPNEFNVWNDANCEDEYLYILEMQSSANACETTDTISVTLLSSGCTDPQACNYNEEAGCEDGSCIFPPSIDLGEDIETCEEAVTLDAGSGFDSYLWSNGETTQTIEVSESGDYSVEVGIGLSEDEFSISLDGDDDYVDFGDETAFHFTDFTLGFWFNTTQMEGNAILLNKDCNGCEGNQGDWLFLLNNGKLQMGCEKGGLNPLLITSADVNDGNWHFACASRDNSTGDVMLYLDGAIAAVGTSGIGPIDNSQPLTFGRYAQTGTNYFNGDCDDIMVCDAVLSQSQIQQYMQCPPTGDEEGLVGYWNFNEGSGTTAIDLSGNGNDGTIVGAAYSDDVPSSSCTNCSSTDTISVTLLSSGCTDPQACNYNEQAGCDDGSCFFANAVFDCEGNCQVDLNNNGVCDQLETGGCSGPGCCGNGTLWDPVQGVCIAFDQCPADVNGDGVVDALDILALIASYGSDCP